MVFTNLQHHEKDAFFALLDEYFSSRPQVLTSIAQSAAGSASSLSAPAASAVHRALASNPEATSKLVSAGLRHAASPSPGSNTANTSDGEALSSVAGRVAAFSARNSVAFTGARSGPPPIAEKPTGHSGLVASRKWGEVDTSSTKNALSSIYGSVGKKNPSPPSPPPAPAAFAPKKHAFAPPPVRSSQSMVAAPPAPAPPPPPAAHQEEEEQEQGEWAEALYDYDSAEPGDLNIRENQRVLVTERTSDDWWTGEFNGKTGLFPASYVKFL